MISDKLGDLPLGMAQPIPSPAPELFRAGVTQLVFNVLAMCFDCLAADSQFLRDPADAVTTGNQ